MPIEVRELVIRGSVVAKSNPTNNHPPVDKESIIQECVDRVTEILKDRKER